MPFPAPVMCTAERDKFCLFYPQQKQWHFVADLNTLNLFDIGLKENIFILHNCEFFW
jgi:hypothetical protein